MGRVDRAPQSEARVRIGFVTPLLYLDRKRFSPATRTITQGSNGAYDAADGWDACTGWGSPRGSELLEALRG